MCYQAGQRLIAAHKEYCPGDLSLSHNYSRLDLSTYQFIILNTEFIVINTVTHISVSFSRLIPSHIHRTSPNNYPSRFRKALFWLIKSVTSADKVFMVAENAQVTKMRRFLLVLLAFVILWQRKSPPLRDEPERSLPDLPHTHTRVTHTYTCTHTQSSARTPCSWLLGKIL